MTKKTSVTSENTTPQTALPVPVSVPGGYAERRLINFYPDISLTTQDGAVTLGARFIQAQGKQGTLADAIFGQLMANPQTPPGFVRSERFRDYGTAAGIELGGGRDAVMLYLATQIKLSQTFAKSDKKFPEIAKEKIGRKVDQQFLGFGEAMQMLGVQQRPAAGQIEDFIESLGFSEDAFDEIKEVAELYQNSLFKLPKDRGKTPEMQPNWRVIQGYIAAKKTPLKDHEPSDDLAMSEIRRGIQILSDDYAEELAKAAEQASPRQLEITTTRAQKEIANLQRQYPQALPIKLLENHGYNISVVIGENVRLLFPWALQGVEEGLRPAVIQPRGFVDHPTKVAFISTGEVDRQNEFDVKRFRRTFIEEVFHVAENNVKIKVNGEELRARDVIDRSKIHIWEQEIPTHRKQIARYVAKLSRSQVSALLENLEHHLDLEGKASASELKQGFMDGEQSPPKGQLNDRARLTQLIIWDAENIIHLPGGYDDNSPSDRNAETLARFHRSYHMDAIYQNVKGADYHKALRIALPGLSELYTRHLAPAIRLEEKRESGGVIGKILYNIEVSLNDLGNNLGNAFSGGSKQADVIAASNKRSAQSPGLQTL